jgi:thiol-disulfide isomerase/thioredoxin
MTLAALASCTPSAKNPDDAAQSAPTIGEVSFASPKELRGLLDAAKGNVVVMNFWATWCPPCVKEMPELAKFYRAFDGKGVTFISVNSDLQTTKDSLVVPFVKSYEIPFPVRVIYVEGTDDLLKHLPLEWNGKPWDGGLPATFVYAPDGGLAWSTVGPVTNDLLAEKVRPLLAKARSDATGNNK